MLPFLTVAVFAVLGAYELWPLWRQRRWGAFAAAGTILLVGLIYSVLQVLHVEFPDVNFPITRLFNPTLR